MAEMQVAQVATPTAPAAAPVQPPPVQLDEKDSALLADVKGLGLDGTAIKAMVNERARVRGKAREMEIAGIVLALQGTGEHPGVTVVAGRPHWPVVVAAVEKALKEQPAALAMSADEDGRTPIDAIVLSVVNAIPEDGRMALPAQPAGSKNPKTVDPNAPLPDEVIAEMAKRL